MLNCRSFPRGVCNYIRRGIVVIGVYIAISVLTQNTFTPKSRINFPDQNQAIQLTESPSPTYSYEQYRALVRSENTDEFISEVLSTVKITEVNLKQIADQPTSEFDEEIKNDVQKLDPILGAAGKKATLDQKLKVQADKIFRTEGFNRLLSDYIPYNRSVSDLREKECIAEVYDEVLPTTSVIIVFTNEAFSTLIRTVSSVIYRTPAHLLSDVILVDDFSTQDHLKGKLERYLAIHFPLDKIRLARLSQRVGLIKAKMVGGHLATGDTITFIDSHCEVLERWVEPLLQRIKDNRTIIPCPQMGFINPETMEISTRMLYPAFLWRGDFYWSDIPEEELNKRSAKHSPIRTPVMVGGLFAVDRKYFWEIGSFDPGMEKWGGENLEIGFRVWQCGGSIEVVPCSHVAHMAKVLTPYGHKTEKWGANTIRAARVWMDEYEDMTLSHWPNLENKTINVAARLAFRERKQCKSFQWYLDNVYPSKFRMQFDSKFYGQVRNEESGLCLDADGIKFGVRYVLPIRPCSDSFPVHQKFFISNDGKLRRERECAIYQGDRIDLLPCDDREANSTTWDYKNGQLVIHPVGLCATVTQAKNGTKVLGLQKCDLKSNAQQWVFSGVNEDAK